MDLDQFRQAVNLLAPQHPADVIADAVNVKNARTIERWISGKNPLPHDLAHRIIDALKHRQGNIQTLIKQLETNNKEE